jgi:acetate kinase
VAIDPAQNHTHGRGNHHRISTPASRIPCLVVPTNEELMIARETLRLIPKPSATI